MTTELLEPIDNITKHPTPEGLMLTLTPAGILPRVSAWLIDATIRLIILIILYIPLSRMGKSGLGLMMINVFIVNWLYPVFFEVWRDGMTPGKKKQGIYVCHDDGTPVTLQSSMVRNLLRIVDFLPFMYSIGIMSLMFNKKSQRLGDMIAGTIVVYKKEQNDINKIYSSIYRFMGSQTANPATNNNYDMNSPIFTFPLNLYEQQALLSFSDRVSFLPNARQQEITNHLSPLVFYYNKLGMQSNNTTAMVHSAVIDRASILKGGVEVKNEATAI